jgi:hypothetical protein
MRTIGERVIGTEIYVDTDSQYNYLEADHLIVAPGVTARVFGIVRKKLHVKPGAQVYLHGDLQGEVINEGGKINIFRTS